MFCWSCRRASATSVIGPFIVIGVGLAVPVYEPGPAPVQPLKTYCTRGAGAGGGHWIVTVAPEANQPGTGGTVPTGALMSRKYSVVYWAIRTVSAAPTVIARLGVVVASDHCRNTYLTPGPAGSVAGATTVCISVTGHRYANGTAVGGFASTVRVPTRGLRSKM